MRFAKFGNAGGSGVGRVAQIRVARRLGCGGQPAFVLAAGAGMRIVVVMALVAVVGMGRSRIVVRVMFFGKRGFVTVGLAGLRRGGLRWRFHAADAGAEMMGTIMRRQRSRSC